MIPVVAYHDDSLVLVKADTAANLVEVIKEVVGYAMPCYEGRNLLLNWSAMKSELMVTMKTTQLTTFHATLAAEAKKRQWPHPLIMVDGTQIRVVRSYNYLGRRITDTGNDTQHAKTRAAMCAASIRQFAGIYRSRSVALKHKVNLCNSLYTLSQMSHGMATLKTFDKRTEKVYSTAYLTSWKACIGSGCIDRGIFIHLTEDDILGKVNKPSWTVWADAARLRLLLRVVKADCPVFRACMMCCSTVGTWWLALADSINRFRVSIPALREMPPFTDATRAIWLQMAALGKQQWRRWVKRYMEIDVHQREQRLRAQEYQPPPPQIEPQLLIEDGFRCNHCEKLFLTYRGMLSHRRQAHGEDSALAARVRDNVCFACNGQYESRVAHLAHLTGNLRCALATMTYCKRLTEPELRAAKLVKKVIRDAPPKR
eukprot:226216-Amphidinium_carterae.1